MNVPVSMTVVCLMVSMFSIQTLAIESSAPPYYEFPPSYEEATTYTVHVQAGEEKRLDIRELIQLANLDYSTLKIKATEKPAGQYSGGWYVPSSSNPGSYGNGRLPHCRLLKQDSYYYRVLLDNTIYESNLSYDDATLLVGKLVSLNACTF